MKHNNDTMSLAVYLVVEKPNNHVQRTLSLMHAEEPIVCVKKQRTGDIEVWSKKGVDKDSTGRTHDIYSVSIIDTVNGGIIGTREEWQLLSNDIINLK